jgi:hypothetical protein
MPIILAIWEAEIRRIKVQGQPGQIVSRDHISKTTKAKNVVGGMAKVCFASVKP